MPPARAVNAGGVATSGLEMSQNAMHLQWSAKEVDEKLHYIMDNIHEQCEIRHTARRIHQLHEGRQHRRLHEGIHAMMGQGII